MRVQQLRHERRPFVFAGGVRCDNRAMAKTKTEKGPLAADARAAWYSVFVLHRRVLREVEKRLAEADLPPLAWYDVLYNLYLAEQETGEGLRHSVLAERAIVSPSGLSRLLDKMIARDLVERHQVPGDRRGASLCTTAAGVELMRQTWQVYGTVLEQHFAPAIAGRERALAAMMEAAITSLDEDPDCS